MAFMTVNDSNLDEAGAWAFLRQARAQCPGTRGGVVLTCADAPPLILNVSTNGDWDSPARVTPEAAGLLDLYLPLCTTPGAAFVMAQMGQSVDGRIATESGHSFYVTGKADIVHLHRLRALADAVVIGAGTAVADDPRLTVRHVPGESPVRVLIDPGLRVPGSSHLFQDAAAPTLVLCDGARAGGKVPANRSGVEWLALDTLAPAHVLEVLAARGLHRVLVEGGGQTVSGFLQAGLLQRLHVTVAPMIIGSGRHGLSLPVIHHLDQALRPVCRHVSLGDDVLFDFDLQPGR